MHWNNSSVGIDKQIPKIYGSVIIDFIVDESGKWIFLEVNPNGQWLWLEQILQIDISKYIVNFLIEGEK